MLIREVMKQPAVTCVRDDSLNRVAQLLWENDCGALPVVDTQGCLVGMVTDRDALMSAYTRGRLLSDLRVEDAMSATVHSCRADDPIEVAERLMAERQVRRIPVVDKDLHPIGVVSLNDLARSASHRKHHGLDRELVATMAAVCQPRTLAATHARAAE